MHNVCLLSFRGVFFILHLFSLVLCFFLCSNVGVGGLSVEDEEDMALAGVVLEQCDFEQALDVMQSTHSDAIGAPKVIIGRQVSGQMVMKHQISFVFMPLTLNWGCPSNRG